MWSSLSSKKPTCHAAAVDTLPRCRWLHWWHPSSAWKLMVGRRSFPFWEGPCSDAMMLWCYVSFLGRVFPVFDLWCVFVVCCLEVPQTSPGEKTYQQIEVLLTKTLHSNHVQRDCFGLTQMLGLLSFYSLMLQHDCWILPPPISPKAPKWPICCELQLAKLTTQAMYCHVQGPLVR